MTNRTKYNKSVRVGTIAEGHIGGALRVGWYVEKTGMFWSNGPVHVVHCMPASECRDFRLVGA